MCCYQTKLQTLEREISRAAQAVTAAQGQIKTAKSAHRKILNSRDSSQAAMTIVQRNLEGAREDGDADEIKKFSDQLALAQTQSPAENFSQQLKKSELKVKQLDEKLQHAAVHKQLHKEARRSLFVLSRRRPIVTHRSSLWIFFSSSFFVFFSVCVTSQASHTKLLEEQSKLSDEIAELEKQLAQSASPVHSKLWPCTLPGPGRTQRRRRADGFADAHVHCCWFVDSRSTASMPATTNSRRRMRRPRPQPRPRPLRTRNKSSTTTARSTWSISNPKCATIGWLSWWRKPGRRIRSSPWWPCRTRLC